VLRIEAGPINRGSVLPPAAKTAEFNANPKKEQTA
jgi:hypothetical protein